MANISEKLGGNQCTDRVWLKHLLKPSMHQDTSFVTKMKNYKLRFLSNWSPENSKVKDKESLSRGIMTHSTNGFKQIKTKPVQACAIDI